MGLNYLLHRHQVSLSNARAAACVEARRSHAMLARGYARQIEALVGANRGGERPLVPLV